MSYTILKVYSAFTTVDDRGSHGERIGAFLSKTDADEAAKGMGWYGGKGSVCDEYAIKLDDGTVFVTGFNPPQPVDLNANMIKLTKELKAKAKAKLSLAEWLSLGLKQDDYISG